MWRATGIFFFLGVISLCFIADYHVKKSNTLQYAFLNAVEAEPWLGAYIDSVEALHLKKADQQFQETVSEWNEKIPFLEDFLEKLRLSDGLSSVENHLYNLSLKHDSINSSIVRYPANRWIYRYSKDPENIPRKEIPGLVIHALYTLSQGMTTYSIEGLKELVDIRNSVVSACNNHDFVDSLKIGGQRTCTYVRSTIMEPHWQTWFKYSKYASDYMPRLIGDYARLSTLKYASLEVCNFAPYKTSSFVQHAIENGLVEVNGWYHYDVGECRTFNKKFIDTDPAFWVHMQQNERPRFERVTKHVNDMLISDANVENDRLVTMHGNDDVNLWVDSNQCVPWESFSFESEVSPSGNCETENVKKASLAKAKPPSAQSEKWYFYAEHPNLIVFNPNSNIDDESAKIDAVKRVKKLVQVINRQETFENAWYADQVPFSVGASPYDMNGSLAQGVILQDVASLSIGGAPLPYRNGDILVSLNGEPVYGVSDLYEALIKHGFSQKSGYKKPVQVGIERDGNLSFYRTSYFFNQNHPEFFDVSEDEAMAWGIADAVTFGVSEMTKCVGTNAAILAGNAISGAIERGLSWLEEREFRKESLKEFSYIDVGKCKWEAEQRKAIAQQRYQNTYINSQWFALVTPSAVRVAGQKTFRNYARKNMAKGRLGVAIADGMLEGIETGIWSIGTSAPELTLEARMKDAGKVAPYGTGLGFISGLVFSGSGKGGK